MRLSCSARLDIPHLEAMPGAKPARAPCSGRSMDKKEGGFTSACKGTNFYANGDYFCSSKINMCGVCTKRYTKRYVHDTTKKSNRKIWPIKKLILPLHSQTSKQGTLTEWLGSGLQNRVQQFESAGYLPRGGRTMVLPPLLFPNAEARHQTLYRPSHLLDPLPRRRRHQPSPATPVRRPSGRRL